MIRLVGWIGTLWLMSSAPAEAKKNKEKNTPPCWVTQPCDPYTTTDYLVGVGSGRSLEDANNAAIGAIARQFSVQLTQQQTSVKDFSTTTRNEDTVSQADHQRLRTETEVQTNVTLEHLQMIEHWELPQDKNKPPLHYVLMVIPRSQWLESIDTERREISMEISKLRRNIEQQKTLYDQLPHYKMMLPLLDRDQALYDQRQVVDSNQSSMKPTLTRRTLGLEVDQRKQQVAIVLPTDTPYRTLISTAISNSPFTVVTTPTSNSQASIQCQDQQSISEPDGYGFIKVQTTLDCSILNGGQSIHQSTFVGKASSRDSHKATEQSLQALSNELNALSNTIDLLWSL